MGGRGGGVDGCWGAGVLVGRGEGAIFGDPFFGRFVS